MKTGSFKKRRLILPGMLFLIILALFAAPRVAEWYLERNSQDLTGRNISIGKIRVNYFTGVLRINDFLMFEADGKTVFASFRQLKIDLAYLPLFRKEYVVQSVSLDDPYVQILQEGTEFNFSTLLKQDSTISEEDTLPGEPAKYILNNINITGGFVKYTDVPLNHTISLDKIDLKIPGFTWNSDSARLNAGFRFVDGGGLYSDLSVNQADSTYSINLKLDSLNLGILEPYVKNYLNISSFRGFISNELLIKGSTGSILKLFVRGNNDAFGFSMQDTLNRTIFSFNNLSVNIDTFTIDGNRLRINSITLKDPYVLFERADSANNWLALLKQSDPGPADTTQQASDTTEAHPGFSYNIPPVSISEGSVLISDKTLKYPFEYKIENLSIKSSEQEDQTGKISLDISALLNGTGSLRINTILNPDNLSNEMDLNLEIGRFRMKDMDPYFRHYFGFPVTGGIMNFKTGNRLREKSLDSDNRIYFRKFTLAERIKAETEYNLPLRLAVGILSDKDGVIDLKAPVKMRGDEVKIINLGRIIFRVIGNLFIKAAVSPFNLLSGLYETDPSSLQEIRLGFTEITPDERNMKSVDIIADILEKKPQLSADFIYCIDKAGAVDSLAYIMTADEFLKSSGGKISGAENIPDTTLIRYLISKLNAGTPDSVPDLIKLCINHIGNEKIVAKIDSLKTAQSGFMSDYLNREKEISPERFRIITVTPDSIKPKVKYPYFRIYFTAGE